MKVLTIGGAMVDTVAIIDDALIERISMTNAGKSFLLLEQGAKTEVVAISTHCGGGGLNSAVAFKRLGHDVAALVKIGRDERSRIILDVMNREGVDDCWLGRTADAPTGASTVISAHDRNAAVFTFRGANSLIAASDLKSAMFDVGAVYVAPLSGGSADILPAAAEHAAKARATLAVNPGIRQITTRFANLMPALALIDILVVNKAEADALVDQAVVHLSAQDEPALRNLAADTLRFATAARNSAPRSAVAALASAIRALGCKSVLLTDGRNGAYLASAGENLFEPAHAAHVVGTAGAGDAFASTFVSRTISGEGAAAALRAAAINSASVVAFADAQTGLLTRENLEARMG